MFTGFMVSGEVMHDKASLSTCRHMHMNVQKMDADIGV